MAAIDPRKVSDYLNRRWKKANRQAKGGWSEKSQWYADQQQVRLLALEARLGISPK